MPVYDRGLLESGCAACIFAFAAPGLDEAGKSGKHPDWDWDWRSFTSLTLPVVVTPHADHFVYVDALPPPSYPFSNAVPPAVTSAPSGSSRDPLSL